MITKKPRDNTAVSNPPPDPNATNGGHAPDTSESRWPASLAVIAALILYVTLPERFTAGPVWLLPSLEAALLIPLMIAAPRRVADEPGWHRAMAVGLIAVVNAANLASLILLVRTLLHGEAGGEQLIFAAMQIWLTNVLVFALWYWEVDRGGPGARQREERRPPDFLFPQVLEPKLAPNWAPRFVDYLYMAFTNAMAFSPTDTLPLTPVAKLLMLIQSLASLATVVLVAARAVNILR
ncbi:MAG: hypothetical protein QOF51_1385 [Chloroflexota bacterium]|nr:hypothetical protein [Chloroflexota bacterium]